jgi:hypothetical protein
MINLLSGSFVFKEKFGAVIVLILDGQMKCCRRQLRSHQVNAFLPVEMELLQFFLVNLFFAELFLKLDVLIFGFQKDLQYFSAAIGSSCMECISALEIYHKWR